MGVPPAERSTGYVVGGISPVGQKRALPSIFVSGGRRGFGFKLAPADLLTGTGPVVAAIAR